MTTSEVTELDIQLFEAARDGFAEKLQPLIDSGANIESKHDFFCDMWGSERGLTPLIVAARHNHVPCIDALLAAGADVNAVEVNGATALVWAAFPGHLEAVSRLLQHPDIDIEKGFAGPLFWAAWESRPAVAEALIAAGARTEHIGMTYVAFGGNPLSVCIAKHQECDDNSDTLATLRLLIRAGAPIDGSADSAAMSPLMHALMLPGGAPLKISIVALLVEAGCNVNFVSQDNGMSPLHFAVRSNDVECVKILLDGAANVHLAIQSTGYTPYDLAVFNGFHQVSAVLAKFGAEALDQSSPGLHVILAALANVASCPDPIPTDVLQELRLFHHQLTLSNSNNTSSTSSSNNTSSSSSSSSNNNNNNNNINVSDSIDMIPEAAVPLLIQGAAYQLFGEHANASQSFTDATALVAAAASSGESPALRNCKIRAAISRSFEHSPDALDLQQLLRQVYTDFLAMVPSPDFVASLAQGSLEDHPLLLGIQALSGLSIPLWHHRRTPATRAELFELVFLDSSLWDDITMSFFAHLKSFLRSSPPAADSFDQLYLLPVFRFLTSWVKYFRGSHSGSEYFLSERKGANMIIAASGSSSTLWETLSLAIAYLSEWKRSATSGSSERLDVLLAHLFANCSNFSRCAPLRNESVSTMICATLLDFRQKFGSINSNLSFAAGVALASLSLSLPLQQQKAQLETLSPIIEYILDRLTLARLGKRLPDDPPEDDSVNNPRYNDWLIILAALCTADTNRKMAWDGDLLAQLDNHHSAENPRRARFLAMKLPNQNFSPASRLYIRPALTDGTAELLMDHLIRLRTVFEIYWSFAFDKTYLDVLLSRHVPDHIVSAWNAVNAEKPVHGTPRTIPQYILDPKYGLIWDIASRLEKTVVNVLWQLGDHDARPKLTPLPKLQAAALLRRSVAAAAAASSEGPSAGNAADDEIFAEEDEEEEEAPKHKLTPPWIMISYNWGHQETILEFREALLKYNLPVWIDVEQMGGSTLEAMAHAVEGAAVVLMCMSKAYQASRNCRSEAEYAFTMKKPIIPIKMEEFQPEGWLGFILGSKLYFQMKKDDENSISDFTIRQIIRETQRHLPANMLAPKDPSAAAAAASGSAKRIRSTSVNPTAAAPAAQAVAKPQPDAAAAIPKPQIAKPQPAAPAKPAVVAAPAVVSSTPSSSSSAPTFTSSAPSSSTTTSTSTAHHVVRSSQSSPINWSPQEVSTWFQQIGLAKLANLALKEGYNGYFLNGLSSFGRWTDAKIHTEIMSNLGLNWSEFIILLGGLNTLFPQ